MHLYFGDPVLTNVTVQGNIAFYGGAVYARDSDPMLENVTLADNAALMDNSGGFYSYGVFDPNVITLTHCNVHGNTPLNFDGMADPTGVDGNISVPPEFLDITAADPLDWDLHLALTSPLIDAGAPSALDPDGSPSDIGAYGGPGSATRDLDWDGYFEWWLPGPYDPATSPGMDCDDRDAGVHPGSGC